MRHDADGKYGSQLPTWLAIQQARQGHSTSVNSRWEHPATGNISLYAAPILVGEQLNTDTACAGQHLDGVQHFGRYKGARGDSTDAASNVQRRYVRVYVRVYACVPHATVDRCCLVGYTSDLWVIMLQ